MSNNYQNYENRWKCIRCDTDNTGNFCCVCGTRRPTKNASKLPAFLGGAVLLLFIAGVAFYLGQSSASHGNNDRAESPAVREEEFTPHQEQVVILPGNTPSPMLPPEPTAWPTEGKSTSGTQLMDISYNNDGTIHSLMERDGGSWTRWEYVYEGSGNFLYRKRSIGIPNFRWSHRYMPTTDITYCIMADVIDNCVEFTLEYEVTEVTKGDGLGPRDLYFQSASDSWQKVGEFSYNTYKQVSKHFVLDYPVSLQAFATPRQEPDDSAFSVNQRLTDVYVADYTYVEVAG